MPWRTNLSERKCRLRLTDQFAVTQHDGDFCLFLPLLEPGRESVPKRINVDLNDSVTGRQ